MFSTVYSQCSHSTDSPPLPLYHHSQNWTKIFSQLGKYQRDSHIPSRRGQLVVISADVIESLGRIFRKRTHSFVLKMMLVSFSSCWVIIRRTGKPVFYPKFRILFLAKTQLRGHECCRSCILSWIRIVSFVFIWADFWMNNSFALQNLTQGVNLPPFFMQCIAFTVGK